MKHLILTLALLACSLLALAQKGISYQAVLLDPKPIEIPGQEITGQPLVNGDVSLKFKIFSSTFVQEFEEVHATKTDGYGLVNVLIGSVSPAAFASLVWDSNPKNLQVWVSFDQGGTYTKVSEQVLTYNPYAIYAETAGKLGGTLGIASGGTGATTAANARTNLGLGNVDNTADVNKPISTATQNALDSKVDKATGKQLSTNDFSTAEKTKLAAITGTNTGDQDLSAYATKTQLASKASASDVTTSLASKVDKEVGKGLSSNDYTTEEKIKLAAISGNGAGSQGPAGLPGATGPQGVAGLPGATGPQGPAGPTGLPGATGPTGLQGTPGPVGPSGLTWKGAWSTTGTYAIDDAVGYGGASYFCINPVSLSTTTPNNDPTKWALLASQGATGPQGAAGPTGATGLTGATGPQGPIGLTGLQGPAGLPGASGNDGAVGLPGATGATGPTGAQGIQGLTGATGPTGAAGPQGPTGANGSAGANGKTVANGTADPATSTGVDGDFYINTATNTLFGPKASGTWPTGVSLVGPTGATGPTGPTGAQGIQGPQGIQGLTGATGPQGLTGATGPTGATGAQGATGANGKTVANGTTDPATSTGVDGDFYINTATNTLFGPKASGAWPTGLSLVGPTGATGAAGLPGATGAQGIQGLTGATGATGAQGIQGLTGATGATGPAPSGTGIVTVSSGTLQTPGALTGDVTTSAAGLVTSIATGAVTSTKLLDGTIATADLADGAVTDAKIAGMAGSKVSGNITGNAANVSGTVAVANGGTGATTLTANNVLLGNGTSALQVVAPGSSGNVLTSNGTTWASTAPSGGGLPTSGNTAGDMLYWNGTAWIKVSGGSNNKFLVFVNNAPTWAPIVGATDVYNPTTGKVWMDRNLGATQVATSSTDANSYGSIYQWGRATDGHQLRTSTTTTTLSSTDTPGNSNFISIPSCSGTLNWRSSQNDNLWQGVSGTNNPCPSGYRLPTEAEWIAEASTWGTLAAGAFASVLKLPVAGVRSVCGGGLEIVGVGGIYWSSTVSGTDAKTLAIGSSTTTTFASKRGDGRSVRCIKN